MKPSKARKHIIDDIKEKIEDEFNYAYETGKAEGLKAGIETQMKTINIQKGDVLIFMQSEVSSYQLDVIRRSLQPEGLLGVIVVNEEAEIGKLSDINLQLLGLTRKAKYDKAIEWITEEARLILDYRDYAHAEGENTIEGARDLLKSIGELKK